MKLRAGELRERITLVNAVAGRDPDYGGETGPGGDLATVFAKVAQAPSGQVETAEQLSGVTSMAFYIRFREDVTTAMFVRFRGKLLNISAVAEVVHREFLLITCQARDGGAA